VDRLAFSVIWTLDANANIEASWSETRYFGCRLSVSGFVFRISGIGPRNPKSET
jgi:hypothetical protein